MRFLCVRSYGALREEDKMWGWDIRGRTFADAPSLSDDAAFLWQLGEMLTSGGLKQAAIEERSAFR